MFKFLCGLGTRSQGAFEQSPSPPMSSWSHPQILTTSFRPNHTSLPCTIGLSTCRGTLGPGRPTTRIPPTSTSQLPRKHQTRSSGLLGCSVDISYRLSQIGTSAVRHEPSDSGPACQISAFDQAQPSGPSWEVLGKNTAQILPGTQCLILQAQTSSTAARFFPLDAYRHQRRRQPPRNPQNTACLFQRKQQKSPP